MLMQMFIRRHHKYKDWIKNERTKNRNLTQLSEYRPSRHRWFPLRPYSPALYWQIGIWPVSADRVPDCLFQHHGFWPDSGGYPVLYQVQGFEGQGGDGKYPGHFSVWVWGCHGSFSAGGEYLLLESGWDFRGQYDGGGVTGSPADVPVAAVQHCGEPFHHGVPVGDQCS